MNLKSLASTRRYDFDWLRVLLILAVLVFHSLRFFDQEDWHVKNAATTMGVQLVVVFISRWLMPTIFVISGVATYYALGKRGSGQFIKDRVLRLLVPLLIGLLTQIPLQGYLEAITHNNYAGSFWQFYAQSFNGLAGLGGSFNWVGNHLWYLEMLFVFSLVLLPLMVWLRSGSGKLVLDWLGKRLSMPGLIYMLALPTLLLLFVINPGLSWVLTEDTWGGWSLLHHIVFFLVGFLLASNQSMQASVRKLRWVSLIAGLVTFVIGAGILLPLGDVFYGQPEYLLVNLFNGLTSWCLILAIMGLGMQHLNFRSRLLDYANEAVLPFYVLHQTILLVIGFFVMRWVVPEVLKWVVTLFGSFACILLIYEFLVRRINLLRVLFGMKPLRQEQMVHKPAVQAS